MRLIAWGLEVGHPFAYFLIFMLIGIPLLAIILFGGQQIIDKWKERKKEND